MARDILGIENASVIEIELLPSWGLQTRQSLTLLHLSTVVFGMFFSILPAMTIIQVCLFLTSTIGGQLNCLFFNLSHVQLAYSFFFHKGSNATDPFWFPSVGRNQWTLLSLGPRALRDQVVIKLSNHMSCYILCMFLLLFSLTGVTLLYPWISKSYLSSKY